MAAATVDAEAGRIVGAKDNSNIQIDGDYLLPDSLCRHWIISNS